MPNNVRVGVQVGGASKASSELDQLKDKFTKLQSTSGKGLLTGVAAGAGIAAFNAVGHAVSDVTQFLGDSVTAYRNAEESQARLTTSLRENVVGWNGDMSAIQDATHA